MGHNSINFSVQEREAGVWRWEYTIGELIKSGEMVVSSRVVASRKVRQQIDRDLTCTSRNEGVGYSFSLFVQPELPLAPMRLLAIGKGAFVKGMCVRAEAAKLWIAEYGNEWLAEQCPQLH